MNAPPSLFERVFSRPPSRWVPRGLATLLFAAPLAAACADHALGDLFRPGTGTEYSSPQR